MSRKINLLIITVRADIGGGTYHTDLMINNLPEIFSIFVSCPKEKPYYKKWENNKRVSNILEIPKRSISLSSLLKLYFFCINNKIDIIHSNGKGAGLYSRILKLLLRNIKVVHMFHGLHIGTYNYFIRRIYFIYEYLFSKLTDFYISVSKGEYENCIRYGCIKAEKSKVIYNGIESINNNDSIKLSENVFKILTVTRFDFQKNMDLAYKIAQELKTHSDIKFIWVGDGEGKKQLQEMSLKENLNIDFIGFSENPYPYYLNSNLYLSTSRWEGLPFSLIESCSASLPILCTDVVGNNEVVVNGYNGYLFENEKVNLAIELILLVKSNNNLRKQLSENCQLYFLENFKLETMINNYVNLYLDLMKFHC